MQYSNDAEDKFYERHKVKPPERIPYLTEDELEEKLAAQAHVCQWQQSGNRLFCTQGNNEHGVMISPQQRLVKTDPTTHQPILANFAISDNN